MTCHDASTTVCEAALQADAHNKNDKNEKMTGENKKLKILPLQGVEGGRMRNKDKMNYIIYIIIYRYYNLRTSFLHPLQGKYEKIIFLFVIFSFLSFFHCELALQADREPSFLLSCLVMYVIF